MEKIDTLINLLFKDNGVVPKIEQVNNRLNGLEGVAKKVGDAFGSLAGKINMISLQAFTENVRNVADSMQNLNAPGVEFQQSMADLSSITGIAGKDLEKLSQVARETGVQSGLGAKGAADAFAILASQIQYDKIGMEGLLALQRNTIQLSHASGMSMSEAATALAATINQFGLNATEASRVTNVLAAGSKYGAAEISDLADSFRITGASASAAGLSVEQTAAALEVLSQSNLKGSESGTALRNILVKLQTDLGADFHVTSLSQALEALKPRLNDVTYLAQLFGRENISAAQYLIQNASAVDEMTRSVTNTNVAQEQATIRTDTWAHKMEVIQANIDNVKISLFNATGGVTGYLSAMGGTAVMVSQMVPLFTVLVSALKSDTAAKIANAAVTATLTAATNIYAVAQAALNAVLAANPYALIVLAIAALVAGLIYAYNHSENFRKIVDKCWESIKNFASSIYNNLVKAFQTLAGWITPVINKIRELFGISDKASAKATSHAQAIASEASAAKADSAQIDNLTKKIQKNTEARNTNLATIGGLENKIQDLQKLQTSASDSESIGIQKQIDLLNKKLQAKRNLIAIGAHEVVGDTTIQGAVKGVTAPKLEAPKAGKFAYGDIDFSQSLTQLQMWDKAVQEARDKTDMATESMNGVGSVFTSIGRAVGGAAQKWLEYGANVIRAAAQAIPQIMALLGLQRTQVAGNTAVAGSGAASAMASIPIIGPIMAIASMAAVVAAMASLPKFAAGAVAYSPTIGMFGEYANASNNPEIVAPSSVIRDIVKENSDGGDVRFVLEGRQLVGLINNEGRYSSRTK